MDPKLIINGVSKYKQKDLGGWKLDSEDIGVGVVSSEKYGIEPTNGENFFELGKNSIHQNINVKPGAKLEFSMDHRGKMSSGDDKTNLIISYTKDDVKYEEVLINMSDDKGSWSSYKEDYVVPEGVESIKVTIDPISSPWILGGSFVDNFNVSVAN